MKIEYIACTTDLYGKMHGQKNKKVVGYVISSHEGSLEYGISEVYASTYVPQIICSIVNLLKKNLISNNPKDAIITLKNLKIPFSSRNGIIKSVIGCLINSLVDLDCKILKIPLHKYLQERIIEDKVLKIYASGGTVAMSDHEISHELSNVEELGYDGYKVRVGLLNWKEDVARINSIFNTKLDKMIDFISGTRPIPYEVKDFEYIVEDLADKDIHWLEEPIDPDDYEGMNYLQNKYLINFAGGEAYNGLYEFQNFIKFANLNYIQLDCSFSGDFFTCKKIVDISKSMNKKTATHVWGSLVTKAANYHMANAFGIDYFEDPLIQTSIDSIFYPNFKFPHSYNEILSNPGIGISFDIKNFDNFSFVEGSEYSW